MNERIQELAFEANLDLDGNVPIGFADKFAKLIIQECFSKLIPYMDDQFITDIESELKEHFGIEE